MWIAVIQLLKSISRDEFVGQTWKKPSATMIDEIVEIDESDEEEADVVVKPSSSREVLDAQEVLRRHLVHRRGINFKMRYDFEQYINGIVENNKFVR